MRLGNQETMAKTARARYLRHFLTAPTHTTELRLDRPEFWMGEPPKPVPWGKRRPSEYKGVTGVGRKRGGPRYTVNPSDEIKPELAKIAEQHCAVTVRKTRDGRIIAYTRSCSDDETLNFLWKNHAFQKEIIQAIHDDIYAALHQVAASKDITYERVINALVAGFNHAMARYTDRLTPYNAWKFYDVTVRPIANSLRGYVPRAEAKIRKNLVGIANPSPENASSPEITTLATLTSDNRILMDALMIWFGPTKAPDIIQDSPFDVVTFLMDPTDYPLSENEMLWIEEYFLRSGRLPSRREESADLAEQYRIKDYILYPNFFKLYDRMGGYSDLPDWVLDELKPFIKQKEKTKPEKNPFDCECIDTDASQDPNPTVEFQPEPEAEPNPFQHQSFSRGKEESATPLQAVPKHTSLSTETMQLAETYDWLPLDLVRAFEPFAALKTVSYQARGPSGFLSQYKRVKGDPAKLTPRWIERRQSFIRRHMGRVEKTNEDLYDYKGFPTRGHLAFIMWAYSPEDPARLKKALDIRMAEIAEIEAEAKAEATAAQAVEAA